MIQRVYLTVLGFPMVYIKTAWRLMSLIIFTADKMSVTRVLLTPLLLVALCSAAPYEVQSTSAPAAPAAGAPEKLVEAVRSVHCSVQYVTIWDTKYEEQPFEVTEEQIK